MAPLVPDFLSNELNVLSGLLVGIAFGYVLEQAGFSSSRRLAGLFYGYDFTVLRVFFTAAITALSGTLLLGWAGLLDLDAIYVNPLFLGPAVLGGVIMGLGFILGGYCPGTSVCAAAIGKKDAIVFVLGGFLGVFAYGEAYPAFAGFANGGALGPVKVYESLGVPRGAFVLFLIAAAVAAFAVTSWIEKRVCSLAPSWSFPVTAHRLAAAGLVALGVALVFLPDRKARLLAQVADPSYQREHPAESMTPDEFAFRLIDEDPRLVVLDVRAGDAQKRLALPGAVALPLEGLLAKEWQPLLGRRHATRVFVDEDGSRSLLAALLAERLGYEDVRMLQGGVAELRRAILDYQPTGAPRNASESDRDRFRSEARVRLAERIAKAKAGSAAPRKAVKKIQGGCS
ncbi:MAG TPA: YeeE/YedE thiosulfate transporter family protein [Vicinamibacteria bacterium]|nr:YeeE/YedE thiosulfate transporter family protein [Vicinamibacteria bacterium]